MSVHLSREDIKKLIGNLHDSFQVSQEQRANHELAKHIQYPKIPSILSESIIATLLEQKKILSEQNFLEITSHHGLADIVARTKDHVLKIEIKSTGESAFQQLGEKDITADFLIWLHFDTFFMDKEANTFEIFIIRNPSLYFDEPTKITLTKLKTLIPNLESKSFRIEEI